MRKRLALAAALLLALPPGASAANGAARLLVSATVVRTVRVSVTEGARGTAALDVRTTGGGGWSAPALRLSSGTARRAPHGPGPAATLPGLAVAPCADDPRYVVVTVLADAPAPAGATGVADGR